MKYYFAYGSNMNHQQMKHRCPRSRFTKKVYLKGYKFIYDGYSEKRNGAVANIIKTGEEKDEVWGGLFEINEDNLSALDCYEGYPNSYNREERVFFDVENNAIQAIVYYRTGKTISKPSKDYRDILIQGAKDCNLSENYITTL